MSLKHRNGRQDVSSRLVYGFTLFIVAVTLGCAGFIGGIAAMWWWEPEIRQAVGSFAPALATRAAEAADPREDLVDTLDTIWDILERNFYDPERLDPQRMIYGAAAGLAASLNDPHTLFVEPLPATIMEQDMQGSFEGIGATVNMIEGRLIIVRPLPDSPAERAGLQPGDVILAADDQSLEGKTLLEAITLIRGPKGTVVRLLIQREGVDEPFVVSVTRDRVDLPIIETDVLEGHIAYLRLTEFNALSQRKVNAALRELLRENPKGLILDLRGNPGGYLQMAVDIAGEFFPRNTLILTERERGEGDKEYRVRRTGVATDIPLVVLINGGSASASEIVAGAIRDHGRGTLIGEPTYGKGSVQSTHRLKDGASLRVTISMWYLPNGDHLDGQGIEPDIAVSPTADDIAAGRDPQLERAVDYLLNGE